MTEWRIRLEGNDQSSGTPFKDTLLPQPLSTSPPDCVERAGLCFLRILMAMFIVKQKKKKMLPPHFSSCIWALSHRCESGVRLFWGGKSTVYLSLSRWSTVIEVTDWIFPTKTGQWNTDHRNWKRNERPKSAEVYFSLGTIFVKLLAWLLFFFPNLFLIVIQDIWHLITVNCTTEHFFRCLLDLEMWLSGRKSEPSTVFVMNGTLCENYSSFLSFRNGSC